MSARNKMLAMIRVTACLFAVFGIAGAQLQAHAQKATNPNPELVGMLTKELNVTPTQATGGAGAIFGLVKSRLSPADFSKMAAAVPGMDGFLKAAPAAAGESAMGSIGSAIPGGAPGGVPAGSIPAGGVPGGAEGLVSLASSFKSLGLSPAMASKFTPVLQNYIGSKGGPQLAGLFAGALK